MEVLILPTLCLLNDGVNQHGRDPAKQTRIKKREFNPRNKPLSGNARKPAKYLRDNGGLISEEAKLERN